MIAVDLIPTFSCLKSIFMEIDACIEYVEIKAMLFVQNISAVNLIETIETWISILIFNSVENPHLKCERTYNTLPRNNQNVY